MLGWDPSEFDNETEIMARHDDIWLPDTTLYNSLVLRVETLFFKTINFRLEMDDSASKKLTHVKLTTLGKNQGAMVELLYPTIYKISCLLNLKYFPFDTQVCIFKETLQKITPKHLDFSKNFSHCFGK